MVRLQTNRFKCFLIIRFIVWQSQIITDTTGPNRTLLNKTYPSQTEPPISIIRFDSIHILIHGDIAYFYAV